MSWILQHKLIFLVVIAVVAFGIWFGLSQSSAPPPLLSTNSADGTPAAKSADQELIGTLLALRAVTLSGGIFSDPAFTTLKDFGTTIFPEPVGRDNPFAPLVGQGTAGTGTGTGTGRGTQLFTPSGR